MPGVNTTIDNASPLIYYSTGDWDTSKATDAFLNEYYQQTYAVTTKAGATATFNFTGTAVWLYGGFRSNHGIYNVTIDGQLSTHNGTAGGDGLFQQVMFSATGLDQGFHTVQLINTKKPGLLATEYYLDLDFIVWENEIGGASDTLNTTTVEDTDPAFTWGPLGTAWSTSFDHLNEFHGGSGHVTVSSSAYVTYTFTGSSVSIYGAVGPDQGPYSAQLDDNPAVNYTATTDQYKAQSLLYIADGLGDGQHTVKLSNMPKSGSGLSIDYAVVNAVQVPLTTSTTTSGSSTTTSSSSTDSAIDTSLPSAPANSGSDSKKGVSTGAIVAAIVGALALMAILSFALMMLRKRRRSKKEEMEPDMMAVAFPEPYSYPGRYIPPSQNQSGGYNPLDSTSTPLYPPSRPNQTQAQEGYNFPIYAPGNGDGMSIFSGGQPAVAPRQSAVSGGSDQLAPSALYNQGRNRSPSDVSGTDFAYSGMSDGTSRYPAHGHSDIDGHNLPPIPPLSIAGDGGYQGYQGNTGYSGNPGNQRTLGLGIHNAPPQQFGLIPARKGTGATLPATASVEEQRQFAALSEQELRQRRMQVAGRAQDFGPVLDPLGVDRPLPELPPDYNQATEALNSSDELSQSNHSIRSGQTGLSGQPASLAQSVQHQPSPPSQSPQLQPQSRPISTQLSQIGHNSQ